MLNLAEIAVTCLTRFRSFRGKRRLITFFAKSGSVSIKSNYGPLMSARLEDFTNRAAIFGLYGQEIYEVVCELMPDDVFVDVGANAGVWSLVASAKVGASGLVIAFEPQLELALEIRKNARLNDYTNILVFELALGERTEWAEFNDRTERHTGQTYIKAGARRGSIPIVNPTTDMNLLSSFCRDRRVMIKIDTEGAELSVIRGLEGLFGCSQVYTVIVEINNRHLRRFNSTSKQIYELMESQGFQPTVRNQSTLPDNEDIHYDEIFRIR